MTKAAAAGQRGTAGCPTVSSAIMTSRLSAQASAGNPAEGVRAGVTRRCSAPGAGQASAPETQCSRTAVAVGTASLIPFIPDGWRASDGRSRGCRRRTIALDVAAIQPGALPARGDGLAVSHNQQVVLAATVRALIRRGGSAGFRKGKTTGCHGSRSRYPQCPPGAAGEGPAQGAVAGVEVKTGRCRQADQGTRCSAWPGASRTSARPGRGRWPRRVLPASAPGALRSGPGLRSKPLSSAVPATAGVARAGNTPPGGIRRSGSSSARVPGSRTGDGDRVPLDQVDRQFRSPSGRTRPGL